MFFSQCGSEQELGELEYTAVVRTTGFHNEASRAHKRRWSDLVPIVSLFLFSCLPFCTIKIRGFETVEVSSARKEQLKIAEIGAMSRPFFFGSSGDYSLQKLCSLGEVASLPCLTESLWFVWAKYKQSRVLGRNYLRSFQKSTLWNNSCVPLFLIVSIDGVGGLLVVTRWILIRYVKISSQVQRFAVANITTSALAGVTSDDVAQTKSRKRPGVLNMTV